MAKDFFSYVVVGNAGHGMGTVWAQTKNGIILSMWGGGHGLNPDSGEDLTITFQDLYEP